MLAYIAAPWILWVMVLWYFPLRRDAIWRRMILPAWLSGISSACRGGSDESVCGENAGARCEAVRSDEGTPLDG